MDRTDITPIPDKWLCGFLQANRGATVADAVAYWQEQERLERLFRLDMLAQHPDDRPEGWQDWPEAHAAA